MKSKILIILLLSCLQSFGQSVPNTTTFSLQDVVNVTGGTSLTAAFSGATGTFDPAYVGSKNSLLNFRNYQQTILACENPALTTKLLWAYTICQGEGNSFFYTTYNSAIAGLAKIVSGCPANGFYAKGLSWGVGDVIYGMLSCGSYCSCPATGYFLLSTATPTTDDPVYHIVNGVLTEIINPTFYYITLTPTDKTITFATQSFTFYIDSNYSSYTITSNQSWCTITSAPSSGAGTVTVHADKNNSTEILYATITINTGSTIASFYVTQNGQ